uniref:Uncharacterized protein n=1 Tax=Meloidogyne javanica TaxID=6303 RepID=A0A915N4Q0_MELJA
MNFWLLFPGKELEEYSSNSETRSAPGDLTELPRVWHCHMDLLQQNDILQQPGPSNLNEPKISKNRRTFVNDRNRELNCVDSRKQKRKKGHLRGTRSNGFASGPPFPKFTDVQKRRLSRNSETDDYYCDDYPWGAPLNEQQKKQQMALIEHEINEMANETLCGLGQWRPQWLQRFARREWMLILMCSIFYLKE